jgi:membrane protein required for colicin V production
MAGLEPIDLLALAIVLIATLRGLALGLIREAFSIAALGAAVIAVRVWNGPFTHWLQNASHGGLPQYLAPWIAGGMISLAVIVAVAIFGRVMRQGARAVGLGWFDRIGGAAIGIAEGALAAGILLLAIGGVLGRDHVLLSHSRSYALLEQVRHSPALAPGDVAAPPPSR